MLEKLSIKRLGKNSKSKTKHILLDLEEIYEMTDLYYRVSADDRIYLYRTDICNTRGLSAGSTS